MVKARPSGVWRISNGMGRLVCQFASFAGFASFAS
jgi:hypothetical protein